MARVGDGTDVPVSPLPVLFLTLMGSGIQHSTMEEAINEMFKQIEKLPPFVQNISRIRKLRPDAFADSGLI